VGQAVARERDCLFGPLRDEPIPVLSKAVSANQWCLLGLVVALMSLKGMVQASAEPRPNSANIRVTPRIVHPGHFAGPDSVRFPTGPEPTIAVEMTSTGDMATAPRRGRKRAGKVK
jgi:hypothetical protein